MSLKKALNGKTFGIPHWMFLAGGVIGYILLSGDSSVSVNASQLINSDPARTTSTGNPRQSWSSPVPVPAGLAGNFGGGNNLTTGLIGTTTVQHGPATVVPLLKNSGFTGNGLDGKPAQNGYFLASKIWNSALFCGATSVQNAKDKVGLAVARYVAAKLQHPINYFETQQFIQGVALVYPTYVNQIAGNLFPNCRFKSFNGIVSDHTQNDGVFDPVKQIGDDMLHYGCLGGPGIAEYGTEALAGDPHDCAGESAVPPNSPYHTS